MAFTVELIGRTNPQGNASTVVRIRGSLEAGTAAKADKEVKPLLAAPPQVVVFDLSGVDFVSSIGISFLLAARKAIEAKGSACYFSSPQAQVRKAFEIMKALPATSVFGSVEELDAYLAEIQRKVVEGE